MRKKVNIFLAALIGSAAAIPSVDAAPLPNRSVAGLEMASPLTAACDTNQDGVLNLVEFTSLFRRKFNRDDHNGDSRLSAEELGVRVTLPADVDGPQLGWTIEEFRALAFRQRDKDRDGVIAWEEEEAGVLAGFGQLDVSGDARITPTELTAPFEYCRKASGRKLARR